MLRNWVLQRFILPGHGCTSVQSENESLGLLAFSQHFHTGGRGKKQLVLMLDQDSGHAIEQTTKLQGAKNWDGPEPGKRTG